MGFDVCFLLVEEAIRSKLVCGVIALKNESTDKRGRCRADTRGERLICMRPDFEVECLKVTRDVHPLDDVGLVVVVLIPKSFVGNEHKVVVVLNYGSGVADDLSFENITTSRELRAEVEALRILCGVPVERCKRWDDCHQCWAGRRDDRKVLAGKYELTVVRVL